MIHRDTGGTPAGHFQQHCRALHEFYLLKTGHRGPPRDGTGLSGLLRAYNQEDHAQLRLARTHARTHDTNTKPKPISRWGVSVPLRSHPPTSDLANLLMALRMVYVCPAGGARAPRGAGVMAVVCVPTPGATPSPPAHGGCAANGVRPARGAAPWAVPAIGGWG